MAEPTAPSTEETKSRSTPKAAFPREPRPGGGSQSFGIFLLAIVVVAAGFFWMKQTNQSSYGEEWQAVFLTNGQVYFGQVKKQNRVELVLKEIYYLQVTRPLQQTAEGEEQANPQGELSLVKLGNELHGPTDAMVINRDHVLFVEDLKEDSNVAQAIANYKAGQ
ncbi:MAG: hypothetical protein HYT31_03885 [Parcubacteria group bacterium]|nr:hypothetical protein [Parcubacteria group bacterium]